MEATHAFIDGNYLRQGAKAIAGPFPQPLVVAQSVLRSSQIVDRRDIILTRYNYYDAEPDAPDAVDPDLEKYWAAVNVCQDTHLRFGFVRGKAAKKPRKQKGVDVLLAVDMLVAAFTNIMQVAVLIAGDLDFLPAVQEVQRRGVAVVIGAFDNQIAEALKDAADRYVPLDVNIVQNQVKF